MVALAQPSLRALALDLIDDDYYEDETRPRRLPLAAALRACPAGRVIAARDGDTDLAVCVLGDGRAFALPDVCPHDGGRLSDGFIEGDRLVCGRHGWEFDAATGERVWPPRCARSWEGDKAANSPDC